MLGLYAPEIVARIVTLIVAFTVHEWAHAKAADELGDDTPRRAGRLTLNPLSHLDPIGSILLLLVGFGWAKPVPVNPFALRNGRIGLVMVAAAGPFSNLALALLAAIPFRMGVLQTWNVDFGGIGGILPNLETLLFYFIVINLTLMLFNLIPIPPLDGSKILAGFAPRDWEPFLFQLERYGPLLLMALFLFGGGILSAIISGPRDLLLRLILGW